MFHLEAIAERIEQETARVITSAYPHYWDENHISYSLCRRLRTVLTFEGDVEHERVVADAYKLTGDLEQKRGDIAVLFSIQYRDGDMIEGVAFLEAKKRHEKGFRFKEIRIPQLRRLLDTSAMTQLLLYDFEPSHPAPLFSHRWWERSWIEPDPIPAHAVCVQVGVALAIRRKDIGLYRHGVRFGEQVAYRHLNGLDLDYSQEAIDAVRGLAGRRIDPPTFTMVVRVRRLPDRDQAGPLVNLDVYEAID